ncbi:MAG: alanine/ornithine racemase family PLP-dependent enzyme [Clostridiales bacterium]|nr:alanine/ornithine racemase family PLP-dependent enzyme [Clostridiales bacterium]
MNAYPRLTVDLQKLRFNTAALSELCHGAGISMAAVTKLFCADRRIVEAVSGLPVDYLADSRLENIARYPENNLKRMLLRAPAPDMAEEVVRYCDISLNSEQVTLKALSEAAERQNKRHGVMLMIDVGDLREGIYYDNVKAIVQAARFAASRSYLNFLGIGVNLTCYGSVIPTVENLDTLCGIADGLERRLGVNLPIVSGGNSSSVYLLKNGRMPKRVSNLRLGESIVRGVETAFGRPIDGLFQDVVILEAKLVEIQNKPSYPKGEMGMNAFGERPFFKNERRHLRGIVAAGRQDTDYRGIKCLDERVEILGASSDHLIVDLTPSERYYSVGDTIRFSLDYSAMLRGFTSGYVARVYG